MIVKVYLRQITRENYFQDMFILIRLSGYLLGMLSSTVKKHGIEPTDDELQSYSVDYKRTLFHMFLFFCYLCTFL